MTTGAKRTLSACTSHLSGHICIDNIEKVQRRALKMIKGFENMSYESRLEKAGLMTLETRRLRADLFEVFKIMNGLEGLAPSDFFVLRDSGHGTRGHKYMIYNMHCHLNVRNYSFSQRVVDEWNGLPNKAVDTNSVNGIKNQRDPILRKKGGLYISQRRLLAPVVRPPTV